MFGTWIIATSTMTALAKYTQYTHFDMDKKQEIDYWIE